MREVMMKAQALAEAISQSEVYKTMHDLEDQVTKDEAATALIAAYMEKRSNVELLLRSPEFDAEKVAAAGQELQDVERSQIKISSRLWKLLQEYWEEEKAEQ